ncbi:MAG: ABC transporter ATP-binding protein [Chloroflexi bacterium]|nr:ABC transporter ATP-binding protein [Anaerolineales bacterium]MCQ3951967.1 ABC transporter ATP-binding protein [Chloroflexota bacterium]MDL1919559.1 ABC transporter ATP-binding protein [Chloroflexi bacterium CFX5]NUQ58256.1 ABC transporter ATP-binding protein [Anaerolineales bacterium]RIK55471.1 MAG: ABC transporter ATP-binding protein [Chloroflexota bacterium]
MTTAISVHNLGKQYKIGAAETKFRYNMLRDVIVDTVSAPIRLAKAMIGKSDRRMNQNYVWALQDVSFDLEEGKVLGVVGRNGAGKSTLLKILSRVTEPTTGTVTVRGRVGSLLEVGTGFHPELTGRENIYMNGAILGMKRSEIDSKFDEIVDFSEVNQFIDTPVKRYSSGMYLRLAFAVAAHLEPEILVVDEVLAVGDAEFQKKCLGKMGDVAQQGRTVLFVSHNMSAILRLTQEAIVLNKGRMIMRGPTQEAVDYYLSSGQSQAGERVWEADEIPAASQPFRPISLKVKERGGKVVDTIRSTESAVVEFEYQLSAPVTGLRVGLYVGTMRGEYVFASFDTDTPELYEKFDTRDAGRYVSRAEIPADIFNEGRYTVGVNASSFGVRRYFMDENALAFNVDISGAPGTQWGEPRVGPVRPRLAWKIEKIRD